MLISHPVEQPSQSQQSAVPNLPPLVLIGGSFDPVHLGHVFMAQQITEQFATSTQVKPSIQFLPTAGSPLKHSSSHSKHRLAMLTLALKNTPYGIATLEIEQKPPVYTINTLKQLKNQYPNRPLIFVMGQDSLANLPKWKNWQQLLDYGHFWVFARQPIDGVSSEFAHLAALQQSVPNAINTHVCQQFNKLLTSQQGCIYLETTYPPAIASSQIRQLIANGYIKQAKKLVKPTVWRYIEENHLYGVS